MKSGIGKNISAKTLRVATVFTGAAACAAAFTPAATAATGRAVDTGQAWADGKTAPHGGIHPLADGRVSGSIRSETFCGADQPTWVHLENYWGDGLYYIGCYGYKGEMLLSQQPTMSKECGGNNFGLIYPAAGASIYFGPGTGFRNFHQQMNVTAIRIGGWTGNDSCQIS